MSGMTGGDPDTIQDGGAALTALGALVGERAAGFTHGRAADSVGDEVLRAALLRFEAAGSQLTTDLGGQLRAAGLLATNASADLRAAGGGR